MLDTHDLELDGLRFRTFNSKVLNVRRQEGFSLTKEDVQRVAEALREQGYTIEESWRATSHVSWLSNGVDEGVSFRVRRAV